MDPPPAGVTPTHIKHIHLVCKYIELEGAAFERQAIAKHGHAAAAEGGVAGVAADVGFVVPADRKSVV